VLFIQRKTVVSYKERNFFCVDAKCCKGFGKKGNKQSFALFVPFSGEGGIRTLGTVARTTVFETVPFDRSGTSPKTFYRNSESISPAQTPCREQAPIFVKIKRFAICYCKPNKNSNDTCRSILVRPRCSMKSYVLPYPKPFFTHRERAKLTKIFPRRDGTHLLLLFGLPPLHKTGPL
jgi:hypothetical protein